MRNMAYTYRHMYTHACIRHAFIRIHINTNACTLLSCMLEFGGVRIYCLRHLEVSVISDWCILEAFGCSVCCNLAVSVFSAHVHACMHACRHACMHDTRTLSISEEYHHATPRTPWSTTGTCTHMYIRTPNAPRTNTHHRAHIHKHTRTPTTSQDGRGRRQRR